MVTSASKVKEWHAEGHSEDQAWPLYQLPRPSKRIYTQDVDEFLARAFFSLSQVDPEAVDPKAGVTGPGMDPGIVTDS